MYYFRNNINDFNDFWGAEEMIVDVNDVRVDKYLADNTDYSRNLILNLIKNIQFLKIGIFPLLHIFFSKKQKRLDCSI